MVIKLTKYKLIKSGAFGCYYIYNVIEKKVTSYGFWHRDMNEYSIAWGERWKRYQSYFLYEDDIVIFESDFKEEIDEKLRELFLIQELLK